MNRFEIHEMGGIFLFSYAIELSRNGKNADVIYYKTKKADHYGSLSFR